ncbi:MAG TPA: thioesterase family protein [Ktedonobacterales bacterium]
MPEATTRVRVSFADVDSSQRIHFTAMFRYFEIAEHHLMRELGLPYSTFLTDIAYPRVHLSTDICSAARYDDLLDVTARVERVGNSSWTDTFIARQAADASGEPGPIVAEGRMTIVAMDPATERARPLPEELRRALSGK